MGGWTCTAYRQWCGCPCASLVWFWRMWAGWTVIQGRRHSNETHGKRQPGLVPRQIPQEEWPFPLCLCWTFVRIVLFGCLPRIDTCIPHGGCYCNSIPHPPPHPTPPLSSSRKVPFMHAPIVLYTILLNSTAHPTKCVLMSYHTVISQCKNSYSSWSSKAKLRIQYWQKVDISVDSFLGIIYYSKIEKIGCGQQCLVQSAWCFW